MPSPPAHILSTFSQFVRFIFYEMQQKSDRMCTVKYLPSWLPGANFQKTALLYKQTTHDLLNIPYNMVLEQIVSGYEA